MKSLPLDVSFIRRTDEFDKQTIPLGFLENHHMKSGVWGKVVVLEGELEYRVFEPDVELTILKPGCYGVIEPQVMHEIRIGESARFFIEYYEERSRVD